MRVRVELKAGASAWSDLDFSFLFSIQSGSGVPTLKTKLRIGVEP